MPATSFGYGLGYMSTAESASELWNLLSSVSARRPDSSAYLRPEERVACTSLTKSQGVALIDLPAVQCFWREPG